MNAKLDNIELSTEDELLEYLLQDDIPDADVFEDELDLEIESDILTADSLYADEPSTPRNKWGGTLRIAVLVISALVFCYSAYMLCNIVAEYTKDARTNKKIDSIIVDSSTSVEVEFPDGRTVTIPFKYDHQKLVNMNEEGLGYIYIPSINKRLPIVMTEDNSYYLRHAVDHTYSMAGSIFVDYRIKDGIKSSHVILHGHNRQDGTMFARLDNYLKESYYKKKNNNVFYLYVNDEISEFKIFSVYISEPISTTYQFNFPSAESLRTYAAGMQAQSLYDTEVDISEASKIVTLSTCTDDTEGRIIVHGVLTQTGKIK